MIVYRLARKNHPDYLSGKGAALYGVRWNQAGTEMIYTAQNRSLAMAEVAVHLTLATLPGDYLMISIFIPDEIEVKELPIDGLPEDWNSFPHSASTQRIGDELVKSNEFCLFRVPSAVIKGDLNIFLKSARKKLGVNLFNFWEKFCAFFSNSRRTCIKMGLIQ